MQTSAAKDELRFLDKYDVGLRADIEEAQHQLTLNPNKPYHSTLECRRFLERLGNCIAVRYGLAKRREAADAEETLAAFIARLARDRKTGIRTKEFGYAKQIKNTGNGVHIDVVVARRDAEIAIDNCMRLANWFEITSGTAGSPFFADLKSSNTSQPSAKPNVVYFPKRDGRAATPSPARATPPPFGKHQRASNEKVAEPRNFGSAAAVLAGLVIAALIGGYYWHRSASPPSGPVPGPFAQAQMYSVVPGENLPHVNERSGPGTEYPILAQIGRGLTVSGIARALDSDNVSWIELADGRGYVKEALLEPSASPAPDNAPAAPQDNTQGVPLPTTNDAPSNASAETQATPEPSNAAPSADATPPPPVEPQPDVSQSTTPGVAQGQSSPPALFRLTIGVPRQQQGGPTPVFGHSSNERMYRPAPPHRGGRP